MVGVWVTEAYLCGAVVGVEDKTVVQELQLNDRRKDDLKNKTKNKTTTKKRKGAFHFMSVVTKRMRETFRYRLPVV